MWLTWRVKPDYSLRRRLMIAIVMVFLVAAVLLFYATRYYGGRAADQAYDRLLAASALAIADQVYAADGAVRVDLPYSSLEMLSLARRDRVFYRIVSPNGETVTGYDDLPLAGPPVQSTDPRFFDAPYLGETCRFVVLGRFLAESTLQGWAMVQVGQSRIERRELAHDIALGALAPIAAFMTLALVFIWFGVNLALRPLATIRRDLNERAPTDLKPLELAVPREVRGFVVAINHFLERLSASFDHMQTFIAEAAHQIRTPLASLRAQIDLAADEDDPAALKELLAKARENAAVTSRLTGQLLSHATVTHRADAVPFQPVDVRQVLGRVLADAEYSAGVRAMDFIVDDDGGELVVQGDRVALREALRNLIDNAVKYGPEGSSIDIRCGRDPAGDGIIVEISDHGPGIADDQKANAFERFRRAGRGDQGGEGSGLGLAIVRQVAETHGTIILLDRPGGGLTARLALGTLKEARP